jgi:hypothetical protein
MFALETGLNVSWQWAPWPVVVVMAAAIAALSLVILK